MGLEGEAHTGAEHCLCQSRVGRGTCIESRVSTDSESSICNSRTRKAAIQDRFRPDCEVGEDFDVIGKFADCAILVHKTTIYQGLLA